MPDHTHSGRNTVSRRAASSTRRRRFAGPAALVAGLLLLVLPIAGCGGSSQSETGSDEPATITVFAAPALSESFTRLAEAFSAANPGSKVNLNFANGTELGMQIEQGAAADVLAVADPAHAERIASLLGSPVVFAQNKLAIVVEAGNPLGITGLADLADPDLLVVLGAAETSAGKNAATCLEKAGVAVQPASLEDSVKGVVTKVSLGEADAGICFATDIIAAGEDVDGVDIPDGQNVLTSCQIAIVKDGEAPATAQAFLDFVLSAEGQRTLGNFGFLPVAAE